MAAAGRARIGVVGGLEGEGMVAASRIGSEGMPRVVDADRTRIGVFGDRGIGGHVPASRGGSEGVPAQGGTDATRIGVGSCLGKVDSSAITTMAVVEDRSGGWIGKGWVSLIVAVCSRWSEVASGTSDGRRIR